MAKIERIEPLYSQEKSKSNNRNSLFTNFKNGNKNATSIGGQMWYIIILIYAVSLTFTGVVTFVCNNGFASREENIKNLDLMKTPEQLRIYQNLLRKEVDNITNINNIANQSFSVVLGSLLGFLSATLTTLSSKDKEILENSASTPESQADHPKE